MSRYETAKNPIVLADVYAERFGLRKAVRDLVAKTGMRAFCSKSCIRTTLTSAVTSKSLLDEQADTFGGSYGGNSSLDAVKAEVESADMVFYIGAMKSDTNTGRFTTRLPEGTVEFYSDTTKVGSAEYPGTDMRAIVPALVPLLSKKAAKPASVKEKIAAGQLLPTTSQVDGDVISQKWLWSRVGAWFKDDDVMLFDMGTAAFGMLPMALPSNAQFHSQCMWGAIGWSVGAALGAAFAARESDPARRTILFVGDGSLQLVSRSTSI